MTARLGGRDVALALPRSGPVMDSLEAATGPATATVRRLAAGLGSTHDIRMVLSHAYPGVLPLHGLTCVPDVDEALRRGPVAPFSVVAADVLCRCLFGMTRDEFLFSTGPKSPDGGS